MISVYELWVGDVKVSTHRDPCHLEALAEGDYADQHWYIIEKRTVVSFHIYRIKENDK